MAAKFIYAEKKSFSIFKSHHVVIISTTDNYERILKNSPPREKPAFWVFEENRFCHFSHVVSLWSAFFCQAFAAMIFQLSSTDKWKKNLKLENYTKAGIFR